MMINFKEELFLYAYVKRVPLTVTLEIISECNFRCVHCYLGNTRRKDILTYEQIVDFGNQVIEMGCLYVILTGGEVLLHPDFKKIYTFFAERGMCVSVFTNGSLINDDTIQLFQKYPPRIVEITMYAFSSDTYKAVTKTNGYAAVKRNILLLKQNHINVLLKMFVMNNNYCDFASICQFARDYSIPFKYDTRIIADASSVEMSYQLDEKLSLELELSKSSTEPKYNDNMRTHIMGNRTNKAFQCGAGRSSCWLKSNYRLRLCNFLSCIEYDLKNYSVAEAWNEMKHYIDKDIPSESKCYGCQHRQYCSYCPAVSFVTFGRTDMMYHPTLYCKDAMIKVPSGNSDSTCKM